MKPQVVYEQEIKNVEDQIVKTSIADNSFLINDDQDQILKTLPGAGDPVHIQTTDNDEKKETTIKAKRLVIKFLNSPNINFSTFTRGEDDRFPVSTTINDNTVFKGFLQQSDISEPFLPQNNQEVTMYAIDGLAYLKDIKLVDFGGNVPRGLNRMIDYICWCLNKTGQSLPVNVVNNLKEEDSPGIWQAQANFINSTSRISTFFSTTNFYKVGHPV